MDFQIVFMMLNPLLLKVRRAQPARREAVVTDFKIWILKVKSLEISTPRSLKLDLTWISALSGDRY